MLRLLKFQLIVIFFISFYSKVNAQSNYSSIDLTECIIDLYVKHVYNVDKLARQGLPKINTDGSLQIKIVASYHIDDDCFFNLGCDYFSDEFSSCIRPTDSSAEFYRFFKYSNSNVWYFFEHWMCVSTVSISRASYCLGDDFMPDDIDEFNFEDSSLFLLHGSLCKLYNDTVYYYKNCETWEQYGTQYDSNSKHSLRVMGYCN